MADQPSEYDQLEANMQELMAQLYGAVDELPDAEALEIHQAVTDIKSRVKPLGERAGLALNIALFESRGNGFDSQE